MSDTVQESGTKRNRNKRTGENRLEEQLSLISELLTQQMNHWLLFPVAFTIMGCVSGLFPISRPDFLMWVCCGFLPVFTFFIQNKTKTLFPFFTLQSGCAASLSGFSCPEYCLSGYLCLMRHFLYGTVHGYPFPGRYSLATADSARCGNRNFPARHFTFVPRRGSCLGGLLCLYPHRMLCPVSSDLLYAALSELFICESEQQRRIACR